MQHSNNYNSETMSPICEIKTQWELQEYAGHTDRFVRSLVKKTFFEINDWESIPHQSPWQPDALIWIWMWIWLAIMAVIFFFTLSYIPKLNTKVNLPNVTKITSFGRIRCEMWKYPGATGVFSTMPHSAWPRGPNPT